MNIVAPAKLIVLFALIYVQNFILALESVKRVQIGAVLDYKSLICEIVFNYRHD